MTTFEKPLGLQKVLYNMDKFHSISTIKHICEHNL